jgi:hypothetical protein
MIFIFIYNSSYFTFIFDKSKNSNYLHLAFLQFLSIQLNYQSILDFYDLFIKCFHSNFQKFMGFLLILALLNSKFYYLSAQFRFDLITTLFSPAAFFADNIEAISKFHFNSSSWSNWTYFFGRAPKCLWGCPFSFAAGADSDRAI